MSVIIRDVAYEIHHTTVALYYVHGKPNLHLDVDISYVAAQPVLHAPTQTTQSVPLGRGVRQTRKRLSDVTKRTPPAFTAEWNTHRVFGRKAKT